MIIICKSIKNYTNSLANHMIYSTIVQTIKSGKLKEPFTIRDLIRACPNLKVSTCHTFPNKHRQNNPSKTSELFILISPGKFKLIRPFKYGF
jgi:hypothetical protein